MIYTSTQTRLTKTQPHTTKLKRHLKNDTDHHLKANKKKPTTTQSISSLTKHGTLSQFPTMAWDLAKWNCCMSPLTKRWRRRAVWASPSLSLICMPLILVRKLQPPFQQVAVPVVGQGSDYPSRSPSIQISRLRQVRFVMGTWDGNRSRNRTRGWLILSKFTWPISQCCIRTNRIPPTTIPLLLLSFQYTELK